MVALTSISLFIMRLNFRVNLNMGNIIEDAARVANFLVRVFCCGRFSINLMSFCGTDPLVVTPHNISCINLTNNMYVSHSTNFDLWLVVKDSRWVAGGRGEQKEIFIPNASVLVISFLIHFAKDEHGIEVVRNPAESANKNSCEAACICPKIGYFHYFFND